MRLIRAIYGLYKGGISIKAKRRLFRFAMLGVSGLLTAITLIVTELGLIEWISLIPLMLFLIDDGKTDDLRKRGIYGYGFFFFFCYYVVTYHWFFNLYPLDWVVGMTPAAAIVVCMLACVGLSILYALFGATVLLITKVMIRTEFLRTHKLFRPFVIAALWAVYEWWQTFGWWGVPWARLAVGQTYYIVGVQTASLFGPFFITFALVLVNALLAQVIRERENISAVRVLSAIAGGVLVFQYGVGTVLYFVNNDSENTVRVAAVQGNLDSNEKWDANSTKITIETYTKYTLEAAEKGATVVVWPESAFPYQVSENNAMGEFCSDLAKEASVTILVGAFTRNSENEELNSLICILPDGSFHETVYSKQRLVPFGEFVPMRDFFSAIVPPLAELVMVDDDFVPGDGPNIISTAGINIGGLICFDSIYEELTRQSVLSGAQIICLGTNDAWFSRSSARYIHNSQAQLRAIESGRYIARAANTGASMIINSKGEIVCELEPLTDGVLVEDICVNDNVTLYTRIGNLFVYLLIAFLTFVVGCSVYKRIRKKADEIG